jgi:hypothetical protein
MERLIEGPCTEINLPLRSLTFSLLSHLNVAGDCSHLHGEVTCLCRL